MSCRFLWCDSKSIPACFSCLYEIPADLKYWLVQEPIKGATWHCDILTCYTPLQLRGANGWHQEVARDTGLIDSWALRLGFSPGYPVWTSQYLGLMG